MPEAIVFVPGRHGNTEYTCIPSCTSMHCMVCKFEKGWLYAHTP